MIRLKRTCYACPEQYDAYDGDRRVGYLRLRHGNFTVECPDAGGTLVYHATPNGDGIFDNGERDHYLRFAVFHIEEWMAGKHGDPAPDVSYVIDDMPDPNAGASDG